MPRLRIPRPFAAIAFAAAVACTTTPTDACACLRERPHTVIHGQVTYAGGAPVANATVTMETGHAVCQSLQVASQVRTDAEGVYRTRVENTGAQRDVCVRLVAFAVDAGRPRTSAPQQFTVAVPREFPADSVRRDIVIPAS